jgi:ribosomal protein S12 methylthiotransferase
LRTSFIVGFPGETEADFKELCDFVRAAQFDWMGVFGYSDVDTAASHSLDARGKVDSALIAERRAHLMAIQRSISARNLRRVVGRRVTALVEGPSKENDLVWEARLESMAPEIDGKLLLTDIETPAGAARPGDIVTAEIDSSHDYDLAGRVIEIVDAQREATHAALPASVPAMRIGTGAALRVLA